MNNKQKLFTKSVFKLALECPTKMYYAKNNDKYSNLALKDEFLASLAEGGFQVGTLAKYYYGLLDNENDIKALNNDEAIRQTQELLQQENVTIAEAAFQFGNCFVRVDILNKIGNAVEIIEVKAKSWCSSESFGKKEPPQISSKMSPYIYDVAFQKYVVENSLKECFPDKKYAVKTFLMMADKDKTCDVSGLNQIFKINKVDDKTTVEVDREKLQTLNGKTQILTPFDVDDCCDKIINGQVDESDNLNMPFLDFVKKMSQAYTANEKIEPEIGSKCFSCSFDTSKDTPEMTSGYRECWKAKAGFRNEDFDKPLVKDLWGANGKFIKSGKYFLADLNTNDIECKRNNNNTTKRKWLQIGFATKNGSILSNYKSQIDFDRQFYLDKDGLKEEMSKWKYPLHFIDFETSAVALPFYAGMRPYEQVAFQFSHHTIDKNGKIEHAGQYLNTEEGKFPNFDFVRELKRQLEKDEGTIFRYAMHENTILNIISEQLAATNESDKEELIKFIDSITEKDKKPKGNRNMVDLLEVVKRYFYSPRMKGSNSIKEVLPAVLNTSLYLQEKYSKPIYGKEIKSLNISSSEPIAWVKTDNDGIVVNPYKQLPNIASYMGIPEQETQSIETVNNGGGALSAYGRMQFSTIKPEEKQALQTALLRYCELDTMAMVFIWEFFNNEI